MSINITTQGPRLDSSASTAPSSVVTEGKVSQGYAAGAISPSVESVSISTMASRLAKAEQTTAQANASLSKSELRDKTIKTMSEVSYNLDPATKAQKAKEIPEPQDSSAFESAEAATKFMDNILGPNPFKGMSREQLVTIYNDESGTFTANEKYAAHRQVYDEEIAWRIEFAEQTRQEYSQTGKLTNSFKAALEHFNALPALEQAWYPENYASSLQERIDLDFNYFTGMAHGQAGTSGTSLADVFGDPKGIANRIQLPDLFARKAGDSPRS
ncbi:hypothetical protein [Pseudoduganella lutea]|uniref:Uncharacterized protein n=1 Tax=Pseudoduganella lutea TaxID=321985 RepID=A0A4P6L448_9BURK|nr:hypothetical protein [Pseudoduganella lutea]QBE66360.1 hypothetical protein EWM63_28100 [Pseudoduganella lutea]